MSRSALAVAGSLFLLGAIAWWLTRVPDGPAPAPPPAAPAAREQVPTPLPPPAALPDARPASPAPAAGTPPRISNREEFVQALEAAGLDGEKLADAYRDWRIGRGYLGADPLAGVPAGNASATLYDTMDRATQKSLADSGDLGALQAYAAGSLPADPVTAVDYYARAAARGSAAAMAETARVLAGIATFEPGGPGDDPTFARRLLALRGGDPERDLREDAAAWALAAIRQYGPIVATPAGLALIQSLDWNRDQVLMAAVCGRSLAILADLSAANAGRDTASLPPAFVAEKDLYNRLPCRDTPAPVMPPRALENCRASPAVGGDNRPLELWVCGEN